MHTPIRDVAVGALVDGAGRVLLARRRAGAHLGGLWELPGGKLEAGESPEDGLRRELAEEIGVRALQLAPLRVLVQHYPDRSLRLHGYLVRAWEGEPVGLEGQALRWESPPSAARLRLPEGTQPILDALRLPRQWIVTPDRFPDLGKLRRVLAAQEAATGLLVRVPSATRQQVGRHLPAIRDLCAKLGAPCVWHRGYAPPDAPEGDLSRSWHLRAAQLNAAALPAGGMPFPCGASCHSPDELQRAERLGLHYALLSPVEATGSHPGARLIGWERAAEWIRGCRIPVFLMGGLGPGDLERALACGAQGIAGISAWGL